MNPKKIFKGALLIGCLSFGLVVTGCGPKGPSDLSLTTDIQAKLFADPSVKAANVKVAVNNGIVTLTGDAPSADVALQVVNIANGLAGVKSIDNQVQITGTTAAAQEPMQSHRPHRSSSEPMSMASNTPPPVQNTMPPPPPDGNATALPPPPVTTPPPAMEHRDAPPPPPPPPSKPTSYTIPAGSDVAVRMIDSINSKNAETGQTFRASLSRPLVVDGETVIPTGAPVTILLDKAKSAGRIAGKAELEVRATSIRYHGRNYDIDTNVNEQEGQGRGKQSAIRTGIGAAAGGIIGAIAGGGKGAAIGTLAGGGAGAGYQLATHGQQVNIASETQLTFRLQSSLVVNTRAPE